MATKPGIPTVAGIPTVPGIATTFTVATVMTAGTFWLGSHSWHPSAAWGAGIKAGLAVGTRALQNRDDDGRTDQWDYPREYQLEHLLKQSFKIATRDQYSGDKVQKNHQAESNRSYNGGHDRDS
jgi:hypothetical protein